MIPMMPFSFILFGFIIHKIWEINLKKVLMNRYKFISVSFKVSFVILVFILLSVSLLSSKPVEDIFNNTYTIENPQVFAEKYPPDREGLPENSVIVGDASRKAIAYNATIFFPYWGMGRYSETTPDTIPKEPIITLKKIMEQGYETYMFKGGASDRDVLYFRYLEAEHGIVLKDFSKTFCKLELVEKNNISETESQSDELCYSTVTQSRISYEIIYRCNCVAFRLDDVKDFSLNDVQIQIMEVFKQHKIPLTIGIIGNSFGDDEGLINYIVTQRFSDDFVLDVANHGWNHEHFNKLNKNAQSLLIKQTNERIYHLVDVYPTIFIPPYNIFNNDTIQAAIENNMTDLSAGYQDKTPFSFSNSLIYHAPQTASTGDIGSNGLYYGLNHNVTFNIIHQTLENRGISVVALHPYEYAIIENGQYINEVNSTQIAELDLLLTKIQEEDIKAIPLEKIKIYS